MPATTPPPTQLQRALAIAEEIQKLEEELEAVLGLQTGEPAEAPGARPSARTGPRREKRWVSPQAIAKIVLSRQLEALANVKTGWMEGSGQAPSEAELKWLAAQLVASFPADIPVPFVCPTPTAGVFLEWALGDWIVSAEFPLPERRCELQATNTRSRETIDVERLLQEEPDFSAVYDFVRRFV